MTHEPFKPCDQEKFKYIDNKFDCPKSYVLNPNQHRWNPIPLPTTEESLTWIEGLVSHVGIGSPANKSGMCIYQYRCNKSMHNQAFYNSDGDLLIIPQIGTLNVITEFGKLQVPPKYILIMPRGVKFSVEVTQESRGYVGEIFDGHFQLPDLGPIGANGLATQRDFEAPIASFEQVNSQFVIYNKFGGELFECTMDHSPYDVVAWYGTFLIQARKLHTFQIQLGKVQHDRYNQLRSS